MNTINKINIVDDEVNCLLHEYWYDNHNNEIMSILYEDSSIFKWMDGSK